MSFRTIPLTKGKFTTVDEADYANLTTNKWCCQSPGYAARRRNKKLEFMHRVIMDAGPGEQVDHINGDKLDNRRSNLRIVNYSQNNMNKGLQSNNTSGYKGVSRKKDSGRWHAYIWKNSKRINIGYFKCKHEAARKYNEYALVIHGEYAKLNDIKEDE